MWGYLLSWLNWATSCSPHPTLVLRLLDSSPPMTDVLQLSNATPRGRLPEELLRLICVLVAFDDLRVVARSSRIGQRAAYPVLWRNVHSLGFLLSAITGQRFKASSGGVNRDWPMGMRREVSIYLKLHEFFLSSQIESWERRWSLNTWTVTIGSLPMFDRSASTRMGRLLYTP